MHRLLTLLLLLYTVTAFCQQDLYGRIISGDMAVSGVFVINKRTGAEVKTDNNGYFTLSVKPGDRIALYGKSVEVREFSISEAALKAKPYELEAELKATVLNEVKLSRINPETLGLVPKGQKQYTPAERRLKTAGEFKPNFLFMLGGGISMPFDPIINAITGRTKMLKKNVAAEQKEGLISKFGNLYTEEQISRTFGIPPQLVNGFVYYAIEDADCAEALRTKNNDLIKLRLMVLAEKYMALQNQKTPDTPNHEN